MPDRFTRKEHRPGTRTGGWSTSGLLTVGSGNLSVNLQVSFYDESDRRQRPAGIYTVQFGVAAPAGMHKKVNPVATITWNTEGNGIQRRISVCDGASISGIADHVGVSVVDQTGVLDPSRPNYSVSILVAPYPRPARGVPPFLRGTAAPVVVAGGANSPLAVPDDSGVATVCVIAVAAGGGLPRVTIRSADPAVIWGQYVPDNSSWIALFPQTQNILLENLGPALSTVSYAVLWGIDG